MNLENLKKRAKDILEADQSILFAYLFGSQPAGLSHSASDIDLAVYLKPAEMKDYLRKDEELLGKLSSSLRTDKVDLKILNVVPLLLQFSIISEGETLFTKDEQTRVNFETSVLERYFEMKPFFDQQRLLIMENLKRR